MSKYTATSFDLRHNQARSAKQRAHVKAIGAKFGLVKRDSPPPSTSWWLQPEAFYATAKQEATRMGQIRTSYRRPQEFLE